MWQLSDPLTEQNMLFWGWFWLGVSLANSDRICGWGTTLWCRIPLLNPINFTQGHLVKIEWLVADVTAAEFPDRAEHAIFLVNSALHFFVNPGRICGRGASLWCRSPLLSPNNIIQGHLMIIEWFFSNVTTVRFPCRAERAILVLVLAGRSFGQFRPCLWSGCHFVN